jgi:pyruvate dehydrogenase E2 component (dihydrolipoamide acetyltransferase)
MEQGTLVRWCKQEGDLLEIGEDLYEVETEKAIVPVQVTRPGKMIRYVTAEGTTVPVGTVLAVVADPGETFTEAQVQAVASGGSVEPPAIQPEGAAAQPGAGASAGASAGANASVGAGAGAREGGSNESAQAASGGRVVAAPKARALAAELGVDLRSVRGTGPEGLIMPDDVRRASAAANAGAAAVASGSAADGAKAAGGPAPGGEKGIARKVPLTAINRSMMSALEKGWQVPQFTQITLVDASGLVRKKESNADGLSYMDFFLEALLSAAKQVPEALVSIHGNEAWYHSEVNVTLALATDNGLLVPVLRNAAALNIVERSKAWRALAERGRTGKLAPEDMGGGLIGLSNLGNRGVDYGTPLLPPGNSLIAFIAALEKRAMVVNDSVQARPSLYLSIAYDHRVIDGVLAARFTSAMKAALEAGK